MFGGIPSRSSMGGAFLIGTDRVEIDIGHAGGEDSLIKQSLRLKVSFPEATCAVIFHIDLPSDRFVYATYKPAKIHQAISL